MDLEVEVEHLHLAHGSPVAATMVVLDQARPHRCARDLLQFDVEGGLDHQPAAEHAFAAQALKEITPHLFGEVLGCNEIEIAFPHRELGRVLDCFPIHLIANDRVLAHAPQHVDAPVLGQVGIDERRIGGRALGQTRQQRRFRNRKLARGLVEVGLGRFADPPSPRAEVDLIQIQIQNLVFGEVTFDPPRQHHLAQLARETPLGAEQHLLDQLHGDRARALLDAAGADVHPGCAQDRRVVDPSVFEKVTVFRGHEGHARVTGQGSQRDDDSPLGREATDEHTPVIQHAAGQRWLIVFDGAKVGEIPQIRDVDECARRARAEPQQEHQR